MNWVAVGWWWLKNRPIRTMKEKRMLKGFKWTAVAALAIGSLTQSLGIDIAPEQIDILVNALAILIYLVSQWLDKRKGP